MAILALVFLAVALVLVGIGLAVGTIGFLLAAILVGLGVVSSSVLIGVRSKRAGAGFRAFIIQCGILAGVPAGIVCALLAQSLWETYGHYWPVIVSGALGGALAGLIVALVLDFAWRGLQTLVSTRFLPAKSKPPLHIDA
jgi:hypothetical protein